MNVTILEVNIKPEARDKFLEVALDNAKHSVEDEPGCLRFDVLQDTSNPSLFYYYEAYTDDASQAAHQQTPHHDRYVERIGELLGEAGRVAHRSKSVFSGDPSWVHD